MTEDRTVKVAPTLWGLAELTGCLLPLTRPRYTIRGIAVHNLRERRDTTSEAGGQPSALYDVFLSHSSADKPWVRTLHAALQAAGLFLAVR